MEEKNCPDCRSENVYFDGQLWICPECNKEWHPSQTQSSHENKDELELVDSVIKDAHGQVLNSGDAVIVIKELKIKGSNSSVKVGTKVKSIRLLDQGDGHNISCKIDGLGSINLKSEFVRKA